MKSFICLGVVCFLILAGISKTMDMAYGAAREIRRRWIAKKAAQRHRAELEKKAYSREVMSAALDFGRIGG